MKRGKSTMSRLRSDQSGLASIVIILIVMVILSTLVLGFSKIIRREQRRALDRQLSSQAFYAAESGINDAVKALESGFSESKINCEPYATGAGKPAELSGNSNKLTNDGSVQYSCLLIDIAPQTLVYDNVGTDKSLVFPVEADVDTDIIDSIVFAWQDKDPVNINAFRSETDTTFPPVNAWGGNVTGMLRADVIPVDNTYDRNSLLNNVRSYFLYPNRNTSNTYTAATVPTAVTYPAQSGEIVRSSCNSTNGASNSPKFCLAKISGIGKNKAFLRVKSIYRSNALEISAFRADGTQLKLVNAQTMVDSTGRTADVSRRIQVRVPTLQDLDLPENVLSTSDSLCKKFSITPNLGVVSDESGDPTCSPNP